MLVLRLAWRNLWRNPKRTMITLAAIGLNTAILIASFGLMVGMMEHTISNVTNLVVGEVQIHAPGYLTDHSLYKTVDEPDRVLSELEKAGLMAAPRSYGYGLAALESKSAGALFWGVDPAAERKSFDLAEHVAVGSFLGDEPKGGAVLGKKLARSLGAEIGSELVVVVQAADGSLGNELFTVTGVLKAAGDALDRNGVIIHRQDYQTLFVSEGRVHEIAVNSRGEVPLEQARAIAARAAPDMEVKTWRDLLPTLSDMVNMYDAALAIFGIVFFLAGALGVLNTMLMAAFERIREFGMLKALGTTPWGIMQGVAAEALFLALVATLAGAVLGTAASFYLQEVGLDTTVFTSGDVSVAGVAFDPIWRAVVSLKTILAPVVIMWAACFLASLYPAFIAARLDPVEAMTRI